MWWRKPSLLLFQKEKILTQLTKQINHKYPKKFPTSKTNKPNTLKSIDKSSCTQRTNLSNISNRIEKPR